MAHKEDNSRNAQSGSELQSTLDRITHAAKEVFTPAKKKARLTLDQIMQAVESGDYIGFCLACGEEHEGIEPDARKYECEACGRREVYGAEELLIRFAL
jgi:DNA-directed RNA polymerase subunit RPC12/RpoP